MKSLFLRNVNDHSLYLFWQSCVETEILGGQEDAGRDVDVKLSDATENAPNPVFNKTLDMTLRTSGGIAFASGLFLAIDEALDPLVGFLVPYGRRYRGANIVAVCIPIILAIYFLLFW